MLYRVTKKYVGGSSETTEGNFKTIEQARAFIQERLAADAIQKVNSIYRIYEFYDLLEEFDQQSFKPHDENETSQGQGNTQTFRPTPFNTSPRPKGTPASWLKDEDDQEDNDK